MRRAIYASLPRRQSQCRDVTFAGPKETTNLLRATTSLPHAGVGNRSQQLHARTPALIKILKTECLLIMNGPIQFIVF